MSFQRDETGAQSSGLVGGLDPAPSLISFQNASLGYGRHTVLSGLSFELRAGDYVGIVGPNGAGKTTLLQAILGSLKPQSGAVRYPRGTVSFGYVPQIQRMGEHFPVSVLEVVLMGRYPRLGPLRRPGPADREMALRCLEQVGIVDLAQRLFRDLSGGQKQRALMARALAAEPEVLVLDEPTNDMDVAAEHATMELVDELHSRRGLLVLMVSHLLNVVVNHVHQVVMLGGRRFAMGPVDELVKSAPLTDLYGLPLSVLEVEGKRVVL
ncbi:MAG TPA: ATP-binding cassette domain-containing protein [Armatimonadota bacterium]|jgi:ABC-type Mn2+/Zn2+ transport system ATPase subunit